jgi:hypothetical protein
VVVVVDGGDPAQVAMYDENEKRHHVGSGQNVEVVTTHDAYRNLGLWDEQVADQAGEEHPDQRTMQR